MAKFYVQSGSMHSIVQAESSRKAALWAVHQVMQQVLPLDTTTDETSRSRDASLAKEPVAVLSGRIRVSEQGFDRDDATSLTTMEVVTQWNQMVTTLDRLEKMLYRAA